MANFFDQFDEQPQSKNFFDQFDEKPAPAPVKEAGFSLKDLAASFGIGALGSTKALTDVAGAENIVSEKLGSGVEGLQRAMTPERQAEMQRQAARMKAAEESGSTLEEIKAAALNVAEAPLQSAAQAIGSFVPYLLSTPVAAGMRLTGASKAAIEAVGRQAPKVIATAQGAGAVKGAIYEGVLQAEIEAGVDPELAKQKADAAQSYFGGNIEQIALGAGLGFVAGSSGVEKFLTPAGRIGAAPSMTRRVAESIVKESIPEAAQGGQERLAQNIALQREGYDVDTFTGVAGAATQEALTGALGAAPIAAMVRPEVKPPESVDQFEKEKQEFREQFGTPEAVAPIEEAAPEEPAEPPTEFPGGYVATPREISRQEIPEAYGIIPEGSDKPLTTVGTQAEAQAKLETLTEIRAEEQARLVEESDKITSEIKTEQRKLDVMEATGQTDTDQYVQAKALFEQKQDEAAQKIEDINNQIVAYSAPLTIAPVGTRTEIQREYVVSRGDEPVGAFASLEEAAATVKNLDPEAFKQAEAEARVKTDDRIQELKQTLTPMLAKFGLQDVGLNVVEKIENDAGGSYLDRLINISLTEDNPIQTMRHEAMHALKDLEFFTPQQWKALTERANKQWIKEYLADVPTELNGVQMSRLDAYKQLGLTQEEIVEEAISDAFGAYDKGATPPPGMIAALFKKLKNFFLNFGQALRGAGFESADDVFQRVERGELKTRKPKAEAKAEPKPEAKEKFSLPSQENERPTEGRTYKLDIEREKRKMARSAFLTDEEQAAVNADAQKLNLTEKQTEQIIKTIKADKKRYPATQGWADLKVIGIDSKTDDDGNVVPDSESPKYAAIAYAYNVPPGSTKAPQKVDPVWLKQVTGKFQSLIENIYKRAAAGDVNAQNIIAHQTWYKNVAATLRQEYGGFGDTLADLLGATSPNTPVDTNWRFSIDVMRRFVRGDFDAEMKKFAEYLDTGKSVSKYPSGDKIRQISGKLYGMNSTNAMLALADMWRAIKPGQAPKARNFALNLIGQSNMATIDVWAARMLRRAANMVPGASFDRIPPPAEQGVSGTWNADATKVTGAFGFGAEVMQNVSDNLAKKGIIVAPPDLQAIAWFAEKELWGKKGWTTKTGEGGSFEENIEAQPTERFIAGHSVQIGSEKPLQKTVLDAQKRIQAVLNGDEGVLAYRVMQTSGLYGNEVEASFDTEIVVDKGQFDPEELIKELASISKKNKQWDIFVSRVVGMNEENKNARPGVEIYFKTPQDMAKIMPVLDRFTSKGQDGFTLAVDPRAEDGTNQYIGVRLQYVPEISMRWDEDLRQELLAPGGLEKVLKDKAELLENIAADVSVMDGVAHAAVANYDTVVIGRENYDDYIGGRIAEEDQTIGGQSWFGQPVRTHVERAVARLQGYQGQVGTGGVSGIGQEPPSGAKLSLRTPTSPQFKQWFGDSKIVDADGKPKVMYHGLAKDTTDFTRKTERGVPIFLTDDPDFANKFATDSFEAVARNPKKYLSEEQIAGGVKRAIAAIRKDYGKDSFGKEMIESLKTGDFSDAILEAREYVQKEIINLLPTGPHIMPLYVRAEKPFDYDNASHVGKVIRWIKENNGSEYIPIGRGTIVKLKDLSQVLKSGNWEAIEADDIQEAIQEIGFDSFYVKEHGRKNIAVYKPNQVKSATGNVGTFSRESNDVRYSLKNVAFPSAEEAKKAVAKTSVPKTEEFKLFIAGNQWNDEDGEPKVFYHATAREFVEFDPDLKVVYLSDTPEAAEPFGRIAEDRLRQEIYRALNKQEKLDFFQRVVDDAVKAGKMSEAEASNFMRRADRKIPEYGNFGDIEKQVMDALLDLSPTRMSIMPLYVRAETPFDFENKDHVDQVINWVKQNVESKSEFAEKKFDALKGSIVQGTPQAIESEGVQRALKRFGFDGYTVRKRGQQKSYAVYNKPDQVQVKSVTGNLGDFSREAKNIKLSLPTIPQKVQDRMGETTTTRERKTVIQNIVDAIRPTSAADFRAKYLNRYNQMSVYDKKRAEEMGGAALLADQSAESAALMSDLGAGVAASAMGFDDRNGGIPVLRNGITTIDKSVKGLIASLAPLAAQGDPAIYQRYQYWAMVKRGQRLDKEGKLTGIDSADVAYAKILQEAHPEFVSVQKDLIAFNNGLVQYMVDTGVLSKERGQLYTKHADYIPFYRQMDGDKTLGPNLFQSLSGVKPPKKLKGAVAEEAPLADFLETMVRNTQSSIQAGIKNYAAQRAINVATQVKAPGMGAERLDFKSTAPDVINILEKGELVSYRTPDPLLINAMMSLNQSELPFIGFLSAPADWLRTLVTKEPGFMMANMMRDSLSAWVTSGQKMTPIAGTVINFGKGLARKSPGFEAMLDAGIIGGYEFSENIEQSGFKLEEDLAKKAGKKDPIYLRPFTSVWDALGKGTTASDAATRALIYERVLADTGNEAEALYRSLEVMNFHRKGSSPLIRVLTAAVPFFNARLQGLDLFYRASTGNMNNKDAASIQRQFFARGMTMMALSGLYWMLVSDDEEYKKQEQETKDNNWIIPAIGAKIPIPFEVGVLFKVIPERIMAYSFGNDTGKDLQESMIRAAVSTFAFNPIPQTIKPILEAVVDYNMFTMRPILGQGMKDIEPEFQVGPSTSNFATVLAQSLGLSPMKVDHIIKGYTGTIGMYAIDTIDIVLDQFGDSPKPTKRFEQLPVIKRFASDPEARGFVTQYYELKDAVDTTVRTMNLLEKTAQPEEYTEYLIKNQGTLAFKDYVRDTEKTMTYLREMKIAIRSSTMTGDEKRDALLEISRMESAITSNIQEIKKAIASVQ